MRQEAIELIVALKGHTLPKGAENAYNRFCKAIAEEEKQEPFAYLDPGLGAFYWAREYPDGPPPGFEPVYLAGSNKRWVGLTNNDLQPIAEEYHILFGSWVYDFSRAIEAKLKEKNT